MICVKIGTKVTVKEQTYHGDGQLHEVSEFSVGKADAGTWCVGVMLVPIFDDGKRGVAVYETMPDFTRKIDEGFIVVGEEAKVENPVLVVETEDSDQFQQQCACLIEKGYKLQTTNCGTDANDDPHYQAIFIHPTAL